MELREAACGSSSGPAPPSVPLTLWLPVFVTTQQSHERKWVILFHYAPGKTQSYPYLCDQLHLGILYLPLQGVDLMSFCHDLNDEFILKEEVHLLPYSVRKKQFQSIYLNGGPAALPLLPSMVSGLQLLQELVVEHLQLLL